jgi:hypothetical protein
LSKCSDGLGDCELKHQTFLYDIGSVFYSPVKWGCELVVGERERDKIKYSVTVQGRVLPNLVMVARQGVSFCPYVSCLLCASPTLLSPRALRPACPVSPTPCSPLVNSGVRTASASLLSGLAFSHPSCSASNFPFGFSVNSLSLLALNSPSTSVLSSLPSVYAFRMRVQM